MYKSAHEKSLILKKSVHEISLSMKCCQRTLVKVHLSRILVTLVKAQTSKNTRQSTLVKPYSSKYTCQSTLVKAHSSKHTHQNTLVKAHLSKHTRQSTWQFWPTHKILVNLSMILSFMDKIWQNQSVHSVACISKARIFHAWPPFDKVACVSMRMEIQTLCQEFMYWNVCQRYSHIGYNGEWYMVVGM